MTASLLVREVLSELRDPALELNLEGTVEWANAAAEHLLASGDDLKGRCFSEFILDPEAAKEITSELGALTESGVGCELELRTQAHPSLPCDLTLYRDSDGSTWFAVLQLLVAPEEAPGRLSDQELNLSRRLSTLQKATHELSAELLDKTILLAEEKSKTEAVLAGMGEGLLVLDREGRAVQVNHAACRILEVTADDVVGKGVHDFPPGSKIAVAAGAAWQQRESAASSAEGQQRLRLAVQEKVLELSAARIEDSRNGFDGGGFVVNLRDVTRQAELDRMKEELISIVSHELRSPLANVVGYLDLVLTQPDPAIPEQPMQFLEVAQKNARRLVRILDEMLDLSRLDAGKVEMSLGDVEVEAMLMFTAMSFRPAAESKNIQLSVESQGDPLARADIDRLQQVLNNLVGNAVKYTPEGGRVFLGCEPAGDDVRITIRDTGIGIRPEDQSKMFQRFFRVRSAETRNISGTGLGLSIAKSIVDAMGGRLTFQSEHGVGTEFTLMLPAARGS